ncbi:hypothetical protein [Clostridium sp.]|uniref:hypothetical protein n=1 Tax=Clostridium sp. TaxID=1506 RepID=UPI0039945736
MNLFNEIYDLTFLPLVTPNSLLDNLNLENYESINYIKKEDYLIAEVKCVIDKKAIIFNYEFNNENYLDCIYFIENGNKEFLFSRAKLLETLRNEYNDKLRKKTI